MNLTFFLSAPSTERERERESRERGGIDVRVWVL